MAAADGEGRRADAVTRPACGALAYASFFLCVCVLLSLLSFFTLCVRFAAFCRPSAEREAQQARQTDATLCAKLFTKYRIFLNREVPSAIFAFAVRACGGEVGWQGTGSPFDESDPNITHHVIDRPVKERFLAREYVQPQWLADCINARVVLPVREYAPGASLPPHLSPFVDNKAEGYVPTRAAAIEKLQEAAGVAEVVAAERTAAAAAAATSAPAAGGKRKKAPAPAPKVVESSESGTLRTAAVTTRTTARKRKTKHPPPRKCKQRRAQQQRRRHRHRRPWTPSSASARVWCCRRRSSDCTTKSRTRSRRRRRASRSWSNGAMPPRASRRRVAGHERCDRMGFILRQ